jgi:hypothetical protein
MVRAADRAGMGPDSTQLKDLRDSFSRMVVTSWQRLNVDPKSLADSAKSEDDRERLAAARIERYIDALLRNQADYVPMPEQLERLLRSEYEAKVAVAGLDRAVERAQAVRAVVDSARAAQPKPSSIVPMPGAQQPPAGASGAAPPAAPPGRGAPPQTPPPPPGR